MNKTKIKNIQKKVLILHEHYFDYFHENILLNLILLFH